MPWDSVDKAKKAGAITKYKKSPVSLAAINKLYDIHDAIKAQGKADNPFAAAMDSWKGLVVLKNGTWLLKPAKKKTEQAENEAAFPVGMSKVGDGSFESFKEKLSNALRDHFGKQAYVYIVSTFRDKVYVSVESEKPEYKREYYEIPYKVNKAGIELGTITKVEKQTKFVKAEQLGQEFRKKVEAFVKAKGSLGDAVNLGMKLRREIICRPTE